MSAAADPLRPLPHPSASRGAAGMGTLVPIHLVLLPMGLGLLAELAGWLLLSGAAPLQAGWYGSPSLLLGVHLVVIGGLLWPVIGAGWQLTPVVTTRPLPPAAHRVAGLVGPSAVLGAALLWVGMAGAIWIGALGASLLILSLLSRSLMVVPLLIRSSGRLGVRVWLLSAELALWGGLAYAALLYLGRLGYPLFGNLLFTNPISGVGHHVALLAAGWVGGWELGLASLLLPMFALGREPPAGPLVLAALLWYSGIALSLPPLWAGGGVIMVLLLGRSLLGAARGLRAAGPGLVQAALALLGLLGATIGAASGLLPPHAVVAGIFVLWLLPLQHGVASRVLPFLLWSQLLAGRSRVAASSLVDSRLVWAQAGATGIGGLTLVLGLVREAEGLARVGAAGLAAGALLHLLSIAGAGTRTFVAWRSAVALPGTSSEPS